MEEQSVMLNCRNFKCDNNKSGTCTQEHIQLVPQGQIVASVTCIQAYERTEPIPIEQESGDDVDELSLEIG